MSYIVLPIIYIHTVYIPVIPKGPKSSVGRVLLRLLDINQYQRIKISFWCYFNNVNGVAWSGDAFVNVINNLVPFQAEMTKVSDNQNCRDFKHFGTQQLVRHWSLYSVYHLLYMQNKGIGLDLINICGTFSKFLVS